MPMILVNGQLTDRIAVTDRGLSYGDGLFETIQVRAGRPLLLAQHLERLRQGCVRLGITTADLIEALRADLVQLASSLSAYGVLKIIVTRGAGGRGYAPSAGLQPSRILMLSAASDYPDRPDRNGVRIRLCSQRLALNASLAGLKHLNRLEQVLARAEWQDAAIREGLMCDSEGYLVEGTMSNLFWVRDGQLYTPLLDRCGVAGVLRHRLLVLAQQDGLVVTQGRYRVAALTAADEVLLCNSLIDIWPVTGLDEQRWSIGPVTRRLQQLLMEDYDAC